MGQLVGVAQEPGCNILHDLYLSHLSFIFCTNLENSNLACTLNTFFCISFSCVTALLTHNTACCSKCRFNSLH